MSVVSNSLPKAFHGFSCKPDEDGNVRLRDFYLMSMVSSACLWQKHGGVIDMVIDKRIYKQFLDLGFGCIYNNVIPMDVPKELNTQLFWSAGKLLAFDYYNEPVVSIDPDLMFWRKPEIPDGDVVMFHQDDKTMKYYEKPAQYKEFFKEDFDVESQPYNAALFYFRDMEFKKYVVDNWKYFMEKYCKQNKPPHFDKVQVFLEQAGISMFAKKYGINISTFRPPPREGETISDNICFHVWGLKNQVKPRVLKRYILKNSARSVGKNIYQIYKLLEIPFCNKKLEDFVIKIN